MKRALLVIGSSVFLSSIAIAQPTPPKPLPSIPMKPIYFQCIDPSATDVDFTLVAKKSKSTGTVRIKGTVKNIGNAAYVSKPDQQEAQLYELRPGSNNPTLISRQRFQNLDPGESISLSVERSWNTADEFPSTFRLVIAYDPDIRSDGNPKNDDCKMNNNTLEKSGAEANALFK